VTKIKKTYKTFFYIYGIFKYKQRLLLRPRQEQTTVTSVSVCLSVLDRIYPKLYIHNSSHFLRILPAAMVRFFRRRCDKWCTSGFADDMLGWNRPWGEGDASRASTQSDSPEGSTELGRSLMSTISLFCFALTGLFWLQKAVIVIANELKVCSMEFYFLRCRNFRETPYKLSRG